jgi:hypothetical protein
MPQSPSNTVAPQPVRAEGAPPEFTSEGAPPPSRSPEKHGEPQYRPTRRTLIIAAAVVAAIVLVVAVILVAAELRDADGDGIANGDRVVTAPLDGREAATLEVLTGATTITVRVADLGDRLYRAATPDGSGLVPRTTIDDDRVQVYLDKRGPAGPDAVEVQLNSRARWTVRVVGGAVDEMIDASAGRLAGLDIVGGAARIEVRLPRPEGTVPVRMSGGANQLAFDVPDGTPTRVRLGSGAASVTVDGAGHSGVGAGTIVATPGWDAATDRYDIDAIAGVAVLTVG